MTPNGGHEGGICRRLLGSIGWRSLIRKSQRHLAIRSFISRILQKVMTGQPWAVALVNF